jgi:hypothetical protein
MVALCWIGVALAATVSVAGPFGSPGANPGPAVYAPPAVMRPLPPVCEPPPCLLDQRKNSLFPWSSKDPNDSSLIGGPYVTRPLTGTPLIPPPVGAPPLRNRTVSPGYQRILGRHSLTAPMTPSAVANQTPNWHHLPSPAEHPGKLLQAYPHYHDQIAGEQEYTSEDFSPDPYYYGEHLNTGEELGVYGGKKMNDVQRPLIEWGLPFYLNGPIPRSGTQLGMTNLTQPAFYVYGDYRTALAYNDNNGNDQTVWASRWNLDLDLWITGTERFHAFWGPLDEDGEFTSLVYDNGEVFSNDALNGWDEETDNAYFEGDLGAILGGLGGFYPKIDVPFAVGLVPLLFQNGIWIEDAFAGAAFTIPARNNPILDWSNYDVTYFMGFDEVTSAAFQGDNEAANIFGFTTFIERRRSYIEFGYAFLQDTTDQDRSYHNIMASYTRRYLNLFSNSMRMIVNTGQGGPADDRTADGVLLLMENSFLTRNPYNVIPYVNLFAGFGTPQSAARAAGPLKNTGINFESDALTGFPFLDDSANDTFGGAFGIDLLGNDFEQQLILEAAVLQTMNNDSSRNAAGNQYAVGARYQRPLSHTLIFRADAMAGWRDSDEDITGARMELRRKF